MQKLRTLLKRFPWTEHLLNLTTLKSKARDLLTKTIVDYLVEKYRFTVKRGHFVFWATEIRAVYLQEQTKVYYNPPGDGSPVATGKLWYRYNNLKRKIRRVANLAPLRREEEPVQRRAQLIDRLHSVSLDDHRQIEDLWGQTFEIRDRTDSISDYYDHFPQLNTPLGSRLLAIDYERMEVGRVHGLREKWTVLSQKIQVLAGNQAVLRPLFNGAGNIFTIQMIFDRRDLLYLQLI